MKKTFIALQHFIFFSACCLTGCLGAGTEQPSRMYHLNHDMLSGRWAPYVRIFIGFTFFLVQFFSTNNFIILYTFFYL